MGGGLRGEVPQFAEESGRAAVAIRRIHEIVVAERVSAEILNTITRERLRRGEFHND